MVVLSCLFCTWHEMNGPTENEDEIDADNECVSQKFEQGRFFGFAAARRF